MTGYAIGIDLGTTNCLLAVFRDGRVEIIENDSGQRSTPAFVTFTENERLIGEVAKNLVVDEPENTVYDVKRLLGTRFDDQRIQDDIRRWTFNVCGSDDDDGMPNIGVKFQSEVRKFRPEEISAMILEKMKQIAETFLEEEVSRAVVSVPAYFSDSQRQATIDSAKIAGLEVLGLVNEPTAAAFCYGMKKKKGRDCKNVLLFDLGSGTFDVSMVHIDDGQFTVKSTVGDCHFGGNDFDNALVDWFLKNFKMQHRIDPSTDKRAMQRLRTECERAKITLSTSNQTSISVDYLYSQQHFSMSITRAQFEVLCRRYFLRILSLVDDVILEAGIPKREIDDIVLVGGCTRIPKIRQLLQDYFQVKEIKHSVNPDLAVVHGAAIQAAILNGHIDCPQWKLVDVCSHSFGIGVSCGRIVTAVKRHTKIPVANEISLVTSHDDQANVMFKIYEGEHVLAKNNNFLGQFKIVDIPPAPKGEETIRLTFEIDPNGILNVLASLSSTSNSQKLVRKQCCLTNEQIEEKREVAKWFQQADQQYRDKIVQKNLLETVLYEIKSKLELITTIITADDRQSIQTKLDQLENCFIKEDKEGRMKSITEQEIVDQRNDLIQIYQSIIDKYFMLKSQ